MAQYLRNILIIGKSGVGKTSITNALLKKDEPSPVDSFMQTDAIKQRYFRECIEKQLEVKIKHITISSNQTEEKDVGTAVKDLKFLNLVLFVLRLEPIDDQLCKQFEKVITCLGPEVSPITAVLVTWFHSFNSRAEEEFVQKLEWLHGFAKKGIHMICLPQLGYIEEPLRPFLSEKSEKSKKTVQNLFDQAEEKVYCGIPADIPCGKVISAQPDVDGSKKILIFGKTGVGKSTVANAILGSDQLPIGSPIESTTRVAGRYKCSDYESISGAVYRIGIIDTVGVADSHSSKSDLPKRMKRTIKEIQSVNLVLFVIKMERFTRQERDSFEDVISLLQSSGKSNPSAVTAFVVTCCEQKSDENRDATKLEVKEYAKNITHFAGKGIYLVGLPPPDQIPEPLKEYYEKIRKRDTNTLQTLVRESQLEIRIQEPEEIRPRQTREKLSDFLFCS